MRLDAAGSLAPGQHRQPGADLEGPSRQQSPVPLRLDARETASPALSKSSRLRIAVFKRGDPDSASPLPVMDT